MGIFVIEVLLVLILNGCELKLLIVKHTVIAN